MNREIENLELTFNAEYEYWVIRVWRKSDHQPLAIPLDAVDIPPNDVDLARLVLFLGA